MKNSLQFRIHYVRKQKQNSDNFVHQFMGTII